VNQKHTAQRMKTTLMSKNVLLYKNITQVCPNVSELDKIKYKFKLNQIHSV